MLPRQLRKCVPALRKGYPAIAITGPRQSGKTTFAREEFADLPYVNFESPLEREAFARDPLGFLARFPDGAVLDEVQNVPDLLSYLQVRIDEERRMGRWALTGSQQLEFGRGVTQSLAGRVALLQLLPLSYAETTASPRAATTLAGAVLRGGYPPLFDPDRELDPLRWLEDYLATHIDRDIRQVVEVRNRGAFDLFLRHCAARSGQLLNTAELARDCTVDHGTVSRWLDVMETCFVVRRLQPHHRNFGKRLVKRSKLYFLDSALACRLLHIADENQLRLHPLWGALAETWFFTEVLKARLGRGLPAQLWFWRSNDGLEVDLLFEMGDRLVPLEIKAGATPSSENTAGLRKLRHVSERDPAVRVAAGFVLYGGTEDRPSGEDRFVPWDRIDGAVAGIV